MPMPGFSANHARACASRHSSTVRAHRHRWTPPSQLAPRASRRARRRRPIARRLAGLGLPRRAGCAQSSAVSRAPQQPCVQGPHPGCWRVRCRAALVTVLTRQLRSTTSIPNLRTTVMGASQRLWDRIVCDFHRFLRRPHAAPASDQISGCEGPARQHPRRTIAHRATRLSIAASNVVFRHRFRRTRGMPAGR